MRSAASQGAPRAISGPEPAGRAEADTHVSAQRNARVDPGDGAPELPAAFVRGLADFLAALRAEAGASRATLAAYDGDLRRFLAWAAGRGALAFAQLDRDLLVDYLAARRAEGAAEATVARNLAAVRMLLRHLVVEGRLEKDPAALVRAPHLRRALPHALDVEQTELLLTQPERDARAGGGWRAQRDGALLLVLYSCGARVSEAVSLRTDGLEPSLRVLRLFGKGDKERLVPCGERARVALARSLEEGRARLPGAAKRAEVFLTASGAPLDRVNAWRRVKRAALRAGLDPAISPHTLRHCFATHLIEGGADLRSVQEMLGHASVRTTEVYTHLDPEHVLGLHRLFHPRA